MLARLANVNKNEITSKTRQALFLIAALCGSAIRNYVISAANLYQLVVPPVFKDLGTEGKEKGLYFSDAA